MKKCHWVQPKLVCQIKFSEWTQDDKLRQPVFLGLREDKDAAVDFNLVLTEDGQFVEVQGSGEEATFSDAEFQAMLSLGRKGVSDLITLQRQAIDAITAPAA